jgi:hypothetical protein
MRHDGADGIMILAILIHGLEQRLHTLGGIRGNSFWARRAFAVTAVMHGHIQTCARRCSSLVTGEAKSGLPDSEAVALMGLSEHFRVMMGVATAGAFS